MPISSINRIKTIATKLNSNDSSILTIYESSGLTIGNELIANHKIISFNCFIKNLKVFAVIQSLAEAALPNFALTDSETDKLYKTLDVEWGSPRKQITTYISSQQNTSSSGDGWFKTGSFSLLNPSGYPYRIYNLMDFFTDNLAIELGDNAKIGIQIEDVGFGLLDASDTVTIHGSYVEEIFVQSPDTIYIPASSNSGTGTGNNGNTQPQFPITTVFRVSASDIQLSNNQLVATWQQPGTSSLVVSQADDSSKPTYQTNVLNGKSAVYFDGLGKFLNVNQSNDNSASVGLIPVTGNWLIFLVAKFEDPTTYGFSSFTLNSNVGVNIGGNNSFVMLLDPYNSYSELRTDYTSNTNWNIYILSCYNDVVTLYINGTEYLLGNKLTTISPHGTHLNKLTIGCRELGVSYLNGYIADVGILNERSVGDINTIGQHFKNLYNLNWTNI